MNIAIAVLLLAYAILFYHYPKFSLGLLIVLLPSYLVRFNVLGIPMTFLEGLILISFIIWFIRSGYRNLNFHFRKFNYQYYYLIIAWLLVAIIGLAMAKFSLSALGTFKAYFVEPILLYILIVNVFKNLEDMKKIYVAMAVSAIIVSLFAIYQKITGQFIANHFWAAEATRRVTSFFPFPNAVGLYLAPILVMTVGTLWIRIKKKLLDRKTILFSVTIILSALAMYFAKSDGAMIASIVGILIFLLMTEKKVRKVVAVITALIVIASFTISPIRQKITMHDLSGQIRQQQWRETFEMLERNHWFLGQGINNYQQSVAPYHHEGIDALENGKTFWQPTEIYLYPHNILLNFWTELGILGVIIFGVLVIKYFLINFRMFWVFNEDGRAARYWELGLIATMIAILVHGLVDVPYLKNDLSAFFFIILGMSSVLKSSYVRK